MPGLLETATVTTKSRWPIAGPMADGITLYHKPTCTKSRAAKRLLDDAGIMYRTVLYMDEPPSLAALKRIAAILDGEPRGLMRPKEALELGFDPTQDHSDDEILAFLAKHPAALQRPIVVLGDRRAVIGRPTERVRDVIGTA